MSLKSIWKRVFRQPLVVILALLLLGTPAWAGTIAVWGGGTDGLEPTGGLVTGDRPLSTGSGTLSSDYIVAGTTLGTHSALSPGLLEMDPGTPGATEITDTDITIGTGGTPTTIDGSSVTATTVQGTTVQDGAGATMNGGIVQGNTVQDAGGASMTGGTVTGTTLTDGAGAGMTGGTVTGTTITDGTATLNSGTLTMGPGLGDTTINATSLTTGNTTINQTSVTTDTITTTGDVTVGGNLDVNGAATTINTTTLAVTGTSYFSDDVLIDGNGGSAGGGIISVTDTAVSIIANDSAFVTDGRSRLLLNPTSASLLVNDTTGGDLHGILINATETVISGGTTSTTLTLNDTEANVGGNLHVTGTSTLDGAATANSTLNVVGATQLDSTLDVDGITRLNDNLYVDSNGAGTAGLLSVIDTSSSMTFGTNNLSVNIGEARMSSGSANVRTSGTNAAMWSGDARVDVTPTNAYMEVNSEGGIGYVDVYDNQVSVMVDGPNGEHGLVVGTTQTTLSGGMSSTTMTLDDGGATFGDSTTSAPVRVTGVKDGTTDFDAVNYRQLKEVKGGIAAVSALAAIPSPVHGKKFSIGAALGYYDEESALAIGAKAEVSPNIRVNAGLGYSFQETVSANVGIGYSW